MTHEKGSTALCFVIQPLCNKLSYGIVLMTVGSFPGLCH